MKCTVKRAISISTMLEKFKKRNHSFYPRVLLEFREHCNQAKLAFCVFEQHKSIIVIIRACSNSFSILLIPIGFYSWFKRLFWMDIEQITDDRFDSTLIAMIKEQILEVWNKHAVNPFVVVCLWPLTVLCSHITAHRRKIQEFRSKWETTECTVNAYNTQQSSTDVGHRHHNAFE